jgi:hypothetical protein
MSNRLSISQYLFQESERDCAIPVFGELSGCSRAAILERFPQAVDGEVKVVEWEEWLRSLGFNVSRYQPDESFTLPCAHLVERAPGLFIGYTRTPEVFLIRIRLFGSCRPTIQEC